MRAIYVQNPGSDYSLVIRSVSPSDVGEHDVLIDVAYAGINRADLFQAEGAYPPPEGASSVLGLEVSGTVVAIGKEVRSIRIGEEVCALLAGGGYAKQVSVPEWRVLSVPQGTSLRDAAAIPETFFTVYQTLFEKAALQPGEVLLVHGGGSGIGTTAIQLARQFGVRVFVTVGDREKCQKCEMLGTERAIHYRKEDFVTIIKDATEGQGADVVLDMVGGSYIQRNIKLLRKHGRLVSIAFLEGAKAELNMAGLLMKNLTWIGSTLRSASDKEIYSLAQSLRQVVWPWIETGEVMPVIDRVFSLSEAQAAHDYMRSSQHFGKILLEI